MKTVGRYELLDPIGYGGMAVVYLARQIDLDRRVALKELRLHSPDEPALAERFLREARTAGSMSHPNIVTVHEYFKHEAKPYIAMEYLRRGSLRSRVASLTLAQTAGVLEGLLAALDHGERFGIVHRDIKPENLLVTDQGQVKVADYGIAKASTVDTNALLTMAGTTVGTPTYMAPEQAMGKELGPYTDLYAVGILAYELVVGRVPFEGTDPQLAIVLRHVNEQIPSAHTVNHAIDEPLSDWIDRLLRKDPAQRTQTAEQAWDELEEIVLRLLGSRWRREARLVSASEQTVAPPLAPAPFASAPVERPRPAEPSFETPAPLERHRQDRETPAAAGDRAWSSPVSLSTPPVTPHPVLEPPRPPTRQTAAQPANRRRRNVLLGVAAVPLAAVAGVVGVVLAAGGGGGGSSDTKGAATHKVQTDEVALMLPASWTKREVPTIPGLHPDHAVAAKPGRGSYVAAELVAGNADPSLLSPKLLSAVERQPKPEAIMLAGQRAYRYDGLAPRGVRERLRVYAVLTNAGVASVVCGTGPTAATAAAAACDRIARTLKLTSAKALSIGPTEEYAAILEKTFASLDARIGATNVELDGAGTVSAEAVALLRIARAYDAAGAALGGAGVASRRRPAGTSRPLNPVDAGLNAKLLTAFGQLEIGYRKYAAAVRRNDAAAKAAARRTVLRARSKVGDAARSLRRAGYSSIPRATPRAEIKSLPSPAVVPPAASPPAAVRPSTPPAFVPPPPPPPSLRPGGGGG